MSTQYLGNVNKESVPTLEEQDAVKRRGRKEVSYGPPRNEFEALLLLSRAEGALALTLPAICGATLAWWELGQFRLGLFILTIAAVFCMTAGLNILADYQDYRKRKMPEAKYLLTEPYHAGSNLLVDGLFPPTKAIQYASMLIGISLASIIGLVISSGWPILFFMGLSAILLCAFLVPPKYRGYLKWGLGEIGIFIGAGLLPLFCGFYVQSATLTPQTLWLSIPFGLLSVSVVFAYSFVHQRTDWIFGRRTLVVTLGEKRSINLGMLLILLAFLMLMVMAVYTKMTLWVLVGLVSLPIAMREFKYIYKLSTLTPNVRFHLYREITKTMLITSIMLIFALWIDRAF